MSLIGQFKIKISNWLIQGKTLSTGRCERLWTIAPCLNEPFPKNCMCRQNNKNYDKTLIYQIKFVYITFFIIKYKKCLLVR